MTGEQWLELALLGVAGVPLARLLAKEPIRREAQRHPFVTVAIAGLACAAIATLLWSTTRSPAALRLPAALAITMTLLAWVRARPTYGARRGLPPGSLGLAASLDAITCEDFYARAARAWGPVFKMSQFHRPVVCVTDLEQGFELLRTQAASLEQLAQPWDAIIPGGYIEFMNGHQHEHYRETLRRPLSGPVISACKPSFATIIRRELSAMADGSATDLETSLSRITSSILLLVFFGVPPDSPESVMFQRRLGAIDRRITFLWRAPRELEADVEEVAGAVRTLAGSGQEGMSVLSELARTNADALEDPTVIRNLVLMVQNARPTLAGMLRWLLKLSCDHPQWTPALRREHRLGDDAVATQFVSELFRLWQSEYAYRRTLHECRVGAFRIPKGWLVRVCLREAHGRADRFPDPTTFDPARFAERRYERHEYAPFSDGPHACFGVALTLAVARSFLHELATGFEARVVGDGPVERGNRHWDHWRPSSAFRVALTARAATPS